MYLPNAEFAIVQKRKLLGYLLSLSNEEGRPKAEYFRTIGFNENNVEAFGNALVEVAASNEVKTKIESKFGVKYVIDGLFESPKGKKVQVRTIWIIEKGESRPRLVTAYHV